MQVEEMNVTADAEKTESAACKATSVGTSCSPAGAAGTALPGRRRSAPEGLEPAAPNLLEQVWTGDRGEASREPRPARPREPHAVGSVGAIKLEREDHKLEKRLCREVGRAIVDFNMIEEGDKVMVCVGRQGQLCHAGHFAQAAKTCAD